MTEFKSIVLGVDFTPGSVSAARQAQHIAQWNSARIHPVHIIEMLVARDLGARLNKMQQDIMRGLDRDARDAWKDFASRIPGMAELAIQLEFDHPLAAILRFSQERSADLIVLGTRGAVDRPRGAGTLATACIRKAPCEVLLVQEGHADPYRSIVACVDFSETSMKALQHAVRFARQDRSRLHVLHVFSGPWNTLWYRTPAVQGTPDYEKQFRAGLEGELREFCRPLQPELDELNAELHIFDFPKHGWGISEFVSQNKCDLVVLGTRGRTNMRDALWGSTAERVIRDEPCSILAVRPVGAEYPHTLPSAQGDAA